MRHRLDGPNIRILSTDILSICSSFLTHPSDWYWMGYFSWAVASRDLEVGDIRWLFLGSYVMGLLRRASFRTLARSVLDPKKDGRQPQSMHSLA